MSLGEKDVLQVEKYGAVVWQNTETDALRRSKCLCLNCHRLGRCDNASAGFELCKKYNIAYMMTRCPDFILSTGRLEDER